MHPADTFFKRHLKRIGVAQEVGGLLGATYCDQDQLVIVGDVGLGIRGLRPGFAVIEEMDFGGVFLIFAQFRIIDGVKKGVKRHDLQAFGVGHVFIQRVVGFWLFRIELPELFELGQCIREPVAHAWLLGEVQRRFYWGLVRCLAEGAIGQGRHERQLIQVERTEFGGGGQHGSQGA